MIVRPAPPQFYQQFGEPEKKAIPFLREILFANNDLSSLALASLHGLFEAKDIPALANLLVRSHGVTLEKALANVHNSQSAQRVLDKANEDEQLQRYLPEAIADTIKQNPEIAAQFVSSVENLLDDVHADIRFGAACALTKYQGVNNSKISRELKAGLTTRLDTNKRLHSSESLKQLMAVETLQRLGSDAKPMIPVLLDYADSVQDKFMQDLALRAAGHIDKELRNNNPNVDQALKNDPASKTTVAK